MRCGCARSTLNLALLLYAGFAHSILEQSQVNNNVIELCND